MNNIASAEQSPVQSAPWLYALFVAGLYLALFSGLYLSSFQEMVLWWGKEDYNYCYFVPFVIAYLIWEKRKTFSAIASLPSWRGLAPLVSGLLLFWLGTLGGEFTTLYLSSWLVLIGLCWCYFGWRKLKAIRFVFVFMLAMFPLPNFIYYNLSLRLQLISSRLGAGIIHLFAIPVLREGNVINLGVISLQVVDACSGLRYIMPLIVLGIVLAYFFRAVFWKRVLLVVSTIPLAIVVNGARIALTGIISASCGLRFAEGFYHDFTGWVVFMASLAFLMGEMWLLGGRSKEAEEVEAVGESGGEKTRGRRAGIGLPVVVSLLLATTFVLAHAIDFHEKTPIGKPFSQFPLKIGAWTGTRSPFDGDTIRELHFSDYMNINFRDAKGNVVEFYVAYYASQSKGKSIHSPATCLPGNGWVFKQSGAVELPLDGRAVSVKRDLIKKYNSTQLVYYWFPQRGRILTNPWQLKLYNFWDALTRRRTDGALVRIITPVGGYEKIGAADKRLQGFAREVWPVLETYLPEAR